MCPATVSGPAQARRLAAQPGVQLTVLASVFGVVCTAVVAWSSFATFGFLSPSLHLVLDTADACVALLVAYLVHARFLRRHRWQDALLAQGLVLLAVASSGLGSALTRLPDVRPGTLDVWLPLAARVGGATLIMAAALADGRPARSAAWLRRSWAVPAALVALATAVLWAARASLPVAVGVQTVPTGPEPPLLTGHAALLGAQVFSGLCFFVASIAFAVQSTHREDELLRWLGPACSLAAFARVHYVLFPSLYTEWLYTGDLLRTGCYLLFLVGAGRELRQYWTARARAAVLEDRRRLARELHDGVVQELAYIRGEAYRLAADEPVGERIIAACDRGLDEARAAVHALGRPADEPLGFVIHRTAGELAERYQVDLEVDVDDSITAHPDQQHALMRITREAVSNAVRHGEARRLQVTLLREGEQRRLAIADDGKGFDVERALTRASGYGLISMRDRARALPGSLEVDAEYGSGSVVTVRW
ncbi:MAG: sensor histidine kinase [Friedmanniella sp.]